MSGGKGSGTPLRVLAWTATALAAFTMAAPFLWMVLTSLMGQLEVFSYPPRLLPADPRWENYPGALTAQPFWRFFVNSAVFAVCVVTGQLVTSATAGYAFARLDFRGRERVFLVFLSTMPWWCSSPASSSSTRWGGWTPTRA
jgi:multiple sugar transport system permease protein